MYRLEQQKEIMWSCVDWSRDLVDILLTMHQCAPLKYDISHSTVPSSKVFFAGFYKEVSHCIKSPSRRYIPSPCHECR